jgi:hypothetical protein
MINKIKRQLLKEVRKIQHKMHNHDFSICGDTIYMNALEYLVILKNGKAFCITPYTYFVPYFRFKDVLFVKKRFYNPQKFEYVDSEMGYYSKRIMVYKYLIKYNSTLIVTCCDGDE